MKKRFLSIALVLCMLLSIVPLTPVVATSGTIGHTLKNGEDNKLLCDETTLSTTTVSVIYDYYFNNNKTLSATGYVLDGGTAGATYKLGADVTITQPLIIRGGTADNPVTLNLNGNILTKTGDTGSAIVVDSNAYFVLEDTVTAGTMAKTRYATKAEGSNVYSVVTEDMPVAGDYLSVTGGVIIGGTGMSIKGNGTSTFGGGVYMGSNATFNMTGGNIVGCTASNGGGGVYIASSTTSSGSTTFTMSSGSIVGCTVTGNSIGGGVYNCGTFIMPGGTISDCTALNNGGGVYNYGTFTMCGGTISDCSASESFSRGGGVYSDGTFTMRYSSTIERCETKETQAGPFGGGGVFVSKGTFTMEGGTIRDCKATQNGSSVFVGNFSATMEANGGSVYGSVYLNDSNGTLINTSGGDGTTFAGEITNNGGNTKKPADPADPKKQNRKFLGWFVEKTITDKNTKYYQEFTFGSTETSANSVPRAFWEGDFEVEVSGTTPLVATDGYYESFTDAWKAPYGETATFTLLKGVTLNSEITVSNKGYTIDLNGKTLTSNITINGATNANGEKVLTVKDNSESKSGTLDGIVKAGASYATLQVTGGTVKDAIAENGGKISCAGGIITTATVNNLGTLECRSGTVTHLNANGGTINHTGGTATCNAKAVCTVCGTEYGVLATNHTGTLGEWQKDENGHWKTYSCCPTVKGAEGTHDFDANGKCECGAVQYNITFNANGGSVTPTTATTNISGKLTLTGLPVPTRDDGFTFNGWFTEKTGGTEVKTDTVFTADTTVHAQWSDNIAPTGEITLGKNSWKNFLNNITFELFFKDTQEVTITATDNDGEDVKIEYLLSNKELTAEELATATFTAYSDKFTVEPNNEYVIYAKLSDETGNVAYINSNGIMLDNVAPVISGITNGETYCTAQTVTVSDKYDVTVTVNGTPVTLDANGQFTLSPASGTQTVVATDKAGNVSVEMIVTVNDGHETDTPATCIKKAMCKHCGLEYGEVDSNNHSNLNHYTEKAATVNTLGNIEYWHCEDCNKYFTDADCKNEIESVEETYLYAVNFNTDGGSAVSSKFTVKWADTVLNGIADPTRSGYEFIGWKCGSSAVTVSTKYSALVANKATASVELTAQWKDITAPTGEITLGKNSWKNFLNNITFGLFFKDTQEVTITATDNDGENVKIEYLLSDKELTAEELATATFTAYSDKFNINPNNEYVIYAKLSDKTGNVTYINSNGIVLDNVAPVISGITNGETYCAAQTVTVSDKYEVTVTVNGTPVTLDANGQFTLSPAEGTQKIVAKDQAGNVSAEMIVTVNDGHTYEWKNENGQYWQKCKFCGNETAKKDIPEITINGADKVCKTHDYKFSFTLPDGSTDVTYVYEFENKGDGGFEPKFENGIYSDTIPSNVLKDETAFTLVVEATTADGYLISTRKDVQILQEHTGGTATCTEKAECEVCGEKYGEVDADNHTTLKHIEAKAATAEVEGNIEYWHCEDCNKYFSDKDGKNEITLADTVIAKLSDSKAPQTGDNSHMALWFALLFVCGGALIGTVAYGKKKKYSAK